MPILIITLITYDYHYLFCFELKYMITYTSTKLINYKQYEQNNNLYKKERYNK